MSNHKLKFHIESEDYFGTLATTLDLMRQDIEKDGYNKEHSKLLEETRDNLSFLQANYKIVKL